MRSVNLERFSFFILLEPRKAHSLGMQHLLCYPPTTHIPPPQPHLAPLERLLSYCIGAVHACVALISTLPCLPALHNWTASQPEAAEPHEKKGIFKILIDRKHGKLSESFAFKGVRFSVVVVVVVVADVEGKEKKHRYPPRDRRGEEEWCVTIFGIFKRAAWLVSSRVTVREAFWSVPSTQITTIDGDGGVARISTQQRGSTLFMEQKE